jgi:MHS family proline/betaine transporter-like MFS transporter
VVDRIRINEGNAEDSGHAFCQIIGVRPETLYFIGPLIHASHRFFVIILLSDDVIRQSHLLTFEQIPTAKRGLMASLASAASEIGALLAVAISALTVALMDEASLQSWGWRIPFLFGAALAGTVWIARSTMEESPEFHRQKSVGSVPDHPLLHCLENHRAAIGRAFAISALGSITYYVGITYVPAFLTSAGSLTEKASLTLSTIAAVVVILVTPFVGALSDRVGRKPVLAALSLANMLLPITMFSLMASGSPINALAGALVLAALAGGVSAVGAVATAEQFPGEGRVTGLALGATGATAIFGGLTPFLAQFLVERTELAIAPGIMIAAVSLCVLPLFLTMTETAPSVSRKKKV